MFGKGVIDVISNKISYKAQVGCKRLGEFFGEKKKKEEEE